MRVRSSRTTSVGRVLPGAMPDVFGWLRDLVHRPKRKKERWDAAGSLGRVGWHTFRHNYRSWLDATGAPLGVQQKLMRHAHISTTMNVYGNALMDSKREANSRVARMALGMA